MNNRKSRRAARQTCRALARGETNEEAFRLLSTLNGVVVPDDGPPGGRRDCAILLVDTRPPAVIVRRENIHRALRAVGIQCDGLDFLLREMAASPKDDGTRYPVLIIVRNVVHLHYVNWAPLSRGGVS